MSVLIPDCGVDLIKQFESFDSQAYPDPIEGWEVPTIGYGTTHYPDGSKVKRGDKCTLIQAHDYLIHHINSICTPDLEKIPTWEQMNPNQRGAIYSFAYNLGEDFYKGRKFNSITRLCDSPNLWKDTTYVKDQFIKYRNPGSPAESGLKRRRLAEAKLFCS